MKHLVMRKQTTVNIETNLSINNLKSKFIQNRNHYNLIIHDDIIFTINM